MEIKEIESSGIKYLLREDGTACVTGVNKDFWKEEKVDCLTIPKEVEYEGARYSVTKIEVRAFDEYDSWTVISIPESVTEIKHWAFAGCDNLQSIEVSAENKMYSSFEGVLYSKDRDVLIRCPIYKTSVNIPEGVEELGDGAFFACRNLTSVVIPDSVTEIGESGFACCESLQSIEVSSENKMYSSFDGVLYNKDGYVLIECPEGKTSVNISESTIKIGKRAFYGCRGLTSVAIPNGVTIIGDWAFSKCERLLSITIPDSVAIIGDSAFDHCSSLTSVAIPKGVIEMGYGVFCLCKSLQSIEVSPENKVYSSFEGVLYNKGRDVLIECPIGKTSVNIPEGVTEIGHCVSFEYNALTSVAIPNCVTEIGYGAFMKCRGLTSVAIPDSVTKIGRDAFCGCSGLTSIIVPKGVTKIRYRAFDCGENLQSIEVSPENKMYSSFEGVLYSKDRDELIECPAGKTSVNIPESVTKIGDDAFLGCRGLTSVVCLAKEPPAVGLFQGSICSTLRVPAGCCEAYQQRGWSKYFEKIEEI